MRKRLLLFLFLSFCGMFNAVSQSWYFTHYQVEDGLSNNAVLCMMQDKLGFMWFGTRDGLNRFDGLSYKIFRNDPSDQHTIGSNAIISLSEADDKKIWVGTEKGLYIFDELTERFVPFKPAGNGAVQSVKVIGDEVYYITLYVLYSYNIKTRQLHTYSFQKEVTSFVRFSDGSLWITTSAGIIAQYNPAHNSFDKTYDLFSQSAHPVSKWIQSVCEAGNGLALVGTSNEGLKLLDTRTGTYKNLITYNPDKTDITVMDILKTGAHEYWVATQSGIYIIDPFTSQYHYIRKKYEDPYSLSDNIVQALCKDRQGGIWASTYFGGINYYSKDQMLFKKYFPKTSENSISGYAVGDIRKDRNGLLWIATEDAGLNRFDPKTAIFKNFNPAINKNTISYSNVQSLLVTEDAIWAGTFLHGLDLLDLNGNRLHNYNTLNAAIGSNFIGSLIKTRQGTIIAGTDKGAFAFSKRGNTFHRITQLPNTFFRTLHEDPQGNIWAGTYGNGIYKYNPQTQSVYHYVFSISNNKSLACNITNTVYNSRDGIIWLATEGGLCRFEESTRQLKIYTTREGLPANVIYTILEDYKKNLWLSTSKGLVRFTPATGHVQLFSKSQGLLTDQFNYRSAYRDTDGTLYFGSVKGMISFHPDSIPDTQFSAPVYITGFQIYNKELPINAEHSPLKQSILFTPKLTLPHNQSTFSIDFASLDYNSPLTIRYAYQMAGLDKGWNYLSSNRKAYYTELAPGNYTFIVKTITDGTGKPADFAQLEIEILPPLWQTWEAYVLYILTGLLLIFLTIKFFINRSRERHKRRMEKLAFEKEKEHYEDKIDFFTNVAHEIKTPLTLIKGPMENIMDEIGETSPIKKNLELMSRNTDRLTHLANQILDFRKIETHGFHLNYTTVNISNLLQELFSRFQPIAVYNHLSFELQAEPDIYAYADEEALNKIFGNLIDNAVKYARSFVRIHLTYADDHNSYKACFINDGFVIPAEDREKVFDSFYRVKDTSGQSGTGIGLTLSRTLAEMHGGRLFIDPDQQDVNVFVLMLPLNPQTKNQV